MAPIIRGVAVPVLVEGEGEEEVEVEVRQPIGISAEGRAGRGRLPVRPHTLANTRMPTTRNVCENSTDEDRKRYLRMDSEGL